MKNMVLAILMGLSAACSNQAPTRPNSPAVAKPAATVPTSSGVVPTPSAPAAAASIVLHRPRRELASLTNSRPAGAGRGKPISPYGSGNGVRRVCRNCRRHPLFENSEKPHSLVWITASTRRPHPAFDPDRDLL